MGQSLCAIRANQAAKDRGDNAALVAGSVNCRSTAVASRSRLARLR